MRKVIGAKWREREWCLHNHTLTDMYINVKCIRHQQMYIHICIYMYIYKTLRLAYIHVSLHISDMYINVYKHTHTHMYINVKCIRHQQSDRGQVAGVVSRWPKALRSESHELQCRVHESCHTYSPYNVVARQHPLRNEARINQVNINVTHTIHIHCLPMTESPSKWVTNKVVCVSHEWIKWIIMWHILYASPPDPINHVCSLTGK